MNDTLNFLVSSLLPYCACDAMDKIAEYNHIAAQFRYLLSPDFN